jgi:hypothetical protein
MKRRVLLTTLACLCGLSIVRAVPVALPQARPASAKATAAVVTVKNSLSSTRPAETIVISAAELVSRLAVTDIRKVHVVDDRSKLDLLTQDVDTNDDGVFEELLFQTDIGPLETKTFTLTVGERRTPKISDFKAYGRFVRERRDDFAWENDRIAHRVYGAALESFARDPLTSSAVDVWTKRVRSLVINDWYMVDDYHADNGTGGDFYSSGKSRGCGGNGLWANSALYPSANFRDTRVLANGPIRVMFELSYPAWDAAGTKMSEVKRITLDAGQNLSRFESVYTASGAAAARTHAAGIKKNPTSAVTTSKETGVMRTWEAFKGDAGHLGCGVIIDPTMLVEFTESDGNYLAVARVPTSGPATYFAGFGWDKSGDFKDVADWDRYLQFAAQRLKSPLVVSLSSR